MQNKQKDSENFRSRCKQSVNAKKIFFKKFVFLLKSVAKKNRIM